MTDVNACHQVSVRACQQDPPQLCNVSSRHHTAVSEPKIEANFLSFNCQTMIGGGFSLKNAKLKGEEMKREREKKQGFHFNEWNWFIFRLFVGWLRIDCKEMAVRWKEITLSFTESIKVIFSEWPSKVSYYITLNKILLTNNTIPASIIYSNYHLYTYQTI